MKIKFKIDSSKSGFTLIETIFSLLLISFIIILIHGFILVINQKPDFKDRTSEVYQWINFIESSHFNFQIANRHQHLTLYSLSQHQFYLLKINSKNHELYMSKQGEGGYMPLLSKVEWIDLSYHQPILTFNINLTNGQKYTFHSLMEQINDK
ncbi:hypothetical protein WR164_06830 [Philodulcilactobacillus myokoensis]|uniref:Competence protein ComGF n=1 Tax=Philodulcilactobacillus myokoensis TaxID=2929573 RepID=A0A9W6ET04_9LACO|nr:competence type IV pilus minor pilin ComGF [Philodulcilactobacillus myokoensis]GLB46704.1 hypothetical protein WR164_06830 [Philodulcilactobacillus myokoensis]